MRDMEAPQKNFGDSCAGKKFKTLQK